MIATLKTYAAEGRKVSFILSYSTKPESGATLSVFTEVDGLTVELSREDLVALSDLAAEARYAAPNQF
ncbi:hypothetical protein ACFWOT_09335 [Streptomyces sp. NPDC058440]|uniref:hypothetical protein n=1 Tax=Streptomyces sp. NPDC058440 TaxID=3346501 RepID=UPI00364AE4D9